MSFKLSISRQAQHAGRAVTAIGNNAAVTLSKLPEFGLQVGLVLDLTNTYRYYDSEEWQSMGIQYSKVCQHH